MAKKAQKMSARGGYPIKSQLPNTPDAADVEKRDGDKYGLANGWVLTHFCNELFYANFTAGLTDPELEAALAAEFPAKEKFQSMTAYRQYYNGALHGFGQGEPLDKEYRLRQVREVSDEEVEAPVKKKTSAKKAEPEAKPVAKKKAAKKAAKK